MGDLRRALDWLDTIDRDDDDYNLLSLIREHIADLHAKMTCGSVLQNWVTTLSYMQQSVLLASIRGPDGLHKDHISKLLIRWLRRCVLYSAFESKAAGHGVAFTDPYTPGGGSFTGPSTSEKNWQHAMDKILSEYLMRLDETPHHFQLHFMHAAEIIGYMHPDPGVSAWWCKAYYRLARDMHLNPETKEQMMKRLGDKRSDWLAAEEVTSAHLP